MNVNSAAVQVFQFVNAAAADAEGRRVAADGTTIGHSKVTWMASPHFFKSRSIIAIYVGDDQAVLEFLQAALGAQFAGK